MHTANFNASLKHRARVYNKIYIAGVWDHRVKPGSIGIGANDYASYGFISKIDEDYDESPRWTSLIGSSDSYTNAKAYNLYLSLFLLHFLEAPQYHQVWFELIFL